MVFSFRMIAQHETIVVKIILFSIITVIGSMNVLPVRVWSACANCPLPGLRWHTQLSTSVREELLARRIATQAGPRVSYHAGFRGRIRGVAGGPANFGIEGPDVLS